MPYIDNFESYYRNLMKIHKIILTSSYVWGIFFYKQEITFLSMNILCVVESLFYWSYDAFLTESQAHL